MGLISGVYYITFFLFLNEQLACIRSMQVSVEGFSIYETFILHHKIHLHLVDARKFARLVKWVASTITWAYA